MRRDEVKHSSKAKKKENMVKLRRNSEEFRKIRVL